MARVNEPAYSVSKASGVCAATGRRIAPGERFVACLVERAGGEGVPDRLERVDYSEEAWANGPRAAAPGTVLGSWRGVMRAGDDAARARVDDAGLRELFEQVLDDAEPGQEAFRYLLALLLIRRKLLRYEGTGGGAMRVRWAKAGDCDGPGAAFEVADPGLDAATLAAAADRLAKVLIGERGGEG